MAVVASPRARSTRETTARPRLSNEVPTITMTSGGRGAARLISCMASTADLVGVRSRASITKPEKANMAPPKVATPSAVRTVRMVGGHVPIASHIREMIHG